MELLVGKSLKSLCYESAYLVAHGGRTLKHTHTHRDADSMNIEHTWNLRSPITSYVNGPAGHEAKARK